MLKKWFKRIVGSCMFVGYLPGPTGTYGSALVIALLWFGRSRLTHLFFPPFFHQFWLLCLAAIAVSVWISNDAEEVFGRADPKQIIVDEVAGQLITFFMIPFSWRTLLLGFVLFRFFDIVKPFPVHKFEELDDGLGITMDDIAAGIYANISLMGILWVYHGIRAFLYS